MKRDEVVKRRYEEPFRNWTVEKSDTANQQSNQASIHLPSARLVTCMHVPCQGTFAKQRHIERKITQKPRNILPKPTTQDIDFLELCSNALTRQMQALMILSCTYKSFRLRSIQWHELIRKIADIR